MRTRGEILRAHYFGLLRKAATWMGLVAVASTMFVSTAANADQETARSVTLSDSGASVSSVSYDIKYTNTTTTAANAVKGVRFQFCNSATGPIYNTSCTLPTGMTRGTGISVQTDNAGAFTNSYTAATSGTTDVLLTNATGNTFTAAHVYDFKLTGFTNPSTVGEFYVRVINCNDTTCTVGAGSNLSWGGFAVDTTNNPSMSVTANVQEDLTFCVGTGSGATSCGAVSGSSVTMTPQVMTTGAPSLATAQMLASTNATSGYSITYNSTAFQATGGDTFATIPAGAALGAGGTAQFGFNVVANSAGNFGTYGANPTNSGIAASPYSTNNQIAYSTAGAVQVGSYTGPTTAAQNYQLSYGANISASTKPGVYTATQTFIATATF